LILIFKKKRLTLKDKIKINEEIDAIKFICKEFWQEIFKKPATNLKTNHKGTFVLKMDDFSYLTKLSKASIGETVNESKKYLTFCCGLIRGGLHSLGFDTIVTSEINKIPSCLFKIQSLSQSKT
jgi:trafficking protein particle complex subunit 6